jgi:hypothetical protein
VPPLRMLPALRTPLADGRRAEPLLDGLWGPQPLAPLTLARLRSAEFPRG